MTELRVSKIREGTVIDHIPAWNARKILSLLDTEEEDDNIMSIIMNVPSEQQGRKDIIKIEDKELKPEEITRAAVFAPGATLNVIRDYDVVAKQRIELPDTIEGVLDCPNPDCITTTREPVRTRFRVRKQDPVTLECQYCESVFDSDDLDLPGDTGR